MNDTVREWVAKAEADLATAARERAVGTNPNNDVICFLCQQCVEKLMKAVLVDRSTTFPRTHDPSITMMGVPVELVPKVQKMIARRSR